jgi:hypothetical protein
MFMWMPPTEAPDSRPAPNSEQENPPSAPDLDSVPLRAIRDLAVMPLRWVLEGCGQVTYWELRCGEEILALARHESWARGGPWGLAKTNQGTWSFRGYGTEVAIETDTGDRMLVTVPAIMFPFTVPYGVDATLSFPNGHDYYFKRWGFLATYCKWVTADNTPLVTTTVRHLDFMTLRMRVGVEVHPPAAALPELDLLITLGLYLTLTPPTSKG